MLFSQKAQRGMILITLSIFLSLLLINHSVKGWMDDNPIAPMSITVKIPLKSSTISYTPHARILIDGNGNFSNQANAEGWSGHGTANNPYMIEGLSITGSFNNDLIVISNTDVYFKITNCLFTEGDTGIRLDHVQNGYIINNTVNNNSGSGIHLENTANITLVNNTITNNDYVGIAHFDSYNITLSGNRVVNSGSWGIDFNDSWNNTLLGNTITQSSSYGIILTRSDSNIITNNTITSNQGAGIWIHMNSDNNRMYYNNLLSNYGCQAHDGISGNVFSYNYWDDWTSPDTNDDGIVDKPYPIEGNANNQDPFPLIFPSGIEILASWFDNFDKTTLDDLWVWSPRESSYSLTTYPGWFTMEVTSLQDTWGGTWESPMLYHPAPEGDWVIETFMRTNAGIESQTGLLFFENTSRWFVWGFVYDNHYTPGVCLEGIEDGSGQQELLFIEIPSTEWELGVYLKIEYIVSTNLFIFHYRKSGDSNYTIGGNYTLDWSNLQIGLWGKSWGGGSNPGYFSMFDYVIVDATDFDSDGDGIANWYEQLNGLDPNSNDAGEDFDHDRLTNIEEFLLNTKANNPDSDNDGLTDGEEVMSYSTNPLNSDTDDDGLKDGEEVQIYATYPISPDSDYDNIPDGWEIANNINPLLNDAQQDPDNDKLVNIDEYFHSTDPLNPDSDKDGLTDGEEVNMYTTDPFNPDSDEDGLTDGEEVQRYKSNPNFVDSDGDELSDYFEVMKYGTDPLNPDTDEDGLTDGEELYIYLTNPLNSDTDGDGISDGEEVAKHKTNPLDSDSDNDFFPDGWDHMWWGHPRKNWDNPFTRVLVLIFLFSLLGLGIWVSFISYQLPRLQQDLQLLFQHFQQISQQFQEEIAEIKNQEELEAMEAAADHVYETFQSYRGFFFLAHQLVNRKWLPSFLKPDLTAWELVFISIQHNFEEFQQIRLKRLEAKY
ncbi:MAG: right-handed parallel beta-helix repeat-containing protein [Promethearchaeota archaeon]